MWNYYVHEGNYQGYNIGFTVNQINKCLDFVKNTKGKVRFGKVIYKKSLQVEIVIRLFLETDSKYKELLNKAKEEEKDPKYEQIIREECIGDIVSKIENLRFFYKDESFKSEEEFRFVLILPSEYVISGKGSELGKNLETGVSINNGIFKPHCDVNIDKIKTISSINISPIMEGELAKSGINRAMKQYGYNKNIDISQSKIPIRY